MKNYIIFYTAIIVFVIGGIKLTSYVIEKEKIEELEKTNFHKNVAGLLINGGDVLPAETANKNIVIYALFTNGSTKSNYLKLNELNSKYANNTAFYLFLRIGDKENTGNFFKKMGVEPAFKVVYKPRELYNYITSLSHYFYNKEDLDKMTVNFGVPVAVVISRTGKIRLYKMGVDKDLMTQIEKALE